MNLNNFLPYKLSILSLKISNGIAKHYEEKFGINIPQWRVLVILNQHKTLTAKSIAKLSQMDKVRISRTVKSLLKQKLISQHIDKTDGRARNYQLTQGGKNLIKAVIPAALKFEQDLLTSLSSDEKLQLTTIIEKLNHRLPVNPTT